MQLLVAFILVLSVLSFAQGSDSIP
ncbi:MAG: hypothetical protein RLZZ316_1677, partial [Bacteroidota bacterium]